MNELEILQKEIEKLKELVRLAIEFGQRKPGCGYTIAENLKNQNLKD